MLWFCIPLVYDVSSHSPIGLVL